MFRNITAVFGGVIGGSLYAAGTATATPITAEPVGVAVPSSTDLINTGIFGSTQVVTPGGLNFGLQVITDLIPLAIYSVFAQALAFVPIDQIAHLS
ncbi:hypothetical protein [Corynebacterium freiburgense]|uniref:hypothetical protein n=1 Tax=Corynebacterium freiburgense TaxID=556548 RepID=UPI0004143939|nr:hypothetical protein [Corynebacterium freiburgense]WJZ02407.1 hypothetical protein CFREI_05560 [Corynebacterium freiburgense]